MAQQLIFRVVDPQLHQEINITLLLLQVTLSRVLSNAVMLLLQNSDGAITTLKLAKDMKEDMKRMKDSQK